MDDKARIEYLDNKVNELECELDETKARLKKYTAPASSKGYYERHKEEQKQRAREYKKRTNYKYTPTPEQQKMYYENLKIARAKKKAEKDEKLKESV